MILTVTTRHNTTAYTSPSSARSSTLLQGFRLLQCAPYAKIGGDATQHEHLCVNPTYMFFLSLPATIIAVPFLHPIVFLVPSTLYTSFPPPHLPCPFHHQPQDKHREIHSRDGGQRLDLSAYIQGSQVQWRGIEVLQVQHATL